MFVVHWGSCTWPNGCNCVEKYGRHPLVRDDEKDMTPEEFAEHWTRRSREMGREHDTWGVVQGQVIKTNWEHKGFEPAIVDGEIVMVPISEEKS